jgi:hypothetical protein
MKMPDIPWMRDHCAKAATTTLQAGETATCLLCERVINPGERVNRWHKTPNAEPLWNWRVADLCDACDYAVRDNWLYYGN